MKKTICALGALLLSAAISAQTIEFPTVDNAKYEKEIMKAAQKSIPRSYATIVSFTNIYQAELTAGDTLPALSSQGELLQLLKVAQPTRRTPYAHIYMTVAADKYGRPVCGYRNGKCVARVDKKIFSALRNSGIATPFTIDRFGSLLFGFAGDRLLILVPRNTDEGNEYDAVRLDDYVAENDFSRFTDAAAADDNMVMPNFRGGDLSDFRTWVSQRVKFKPATTAEGYVVAQFVVDKDGSVTDIVITEAPNEAMAAALYKVLRKSPRWEPAKRDGQPVKFKYTLPIRITFDMD